MNILYTLGRYWPTVGGGELHTRELVNHITERNHAMVVCLRNDNCTDWLHGMTVNPQRRRKPYFDSGAEVRVIRLGTIRRSALKRKLADYNSSEEYRISCKRTLANLFEKELAKIGSSFDVVHNVMIGEEFFSLASLNYASKKGIPFVFTPFSHPDGWRGELFSHIYSNADAIFAMTKAEKSFLISQGGRRDRIHIIGAAPLLANTAPSEDIKKKLSIDGPMLLFLGQKYHYKGMKQMLEAAPLVWEKHPAVHFVFAGPATGHSEKLFEGEHDDRIIETGPVIGMEKVNFLASCDIFCMPSVCESFGMVYLEAWAFRKPVIAADTETSRCFIENGRDGLLVQQEASSIAQTICRLIADAGLRDKLGNNGCSKMSTHYTWPKIAARVESIYRSVINLRAKRANL